VLDLQLKLLADAGIVGAPNAGKSTLLAAVSAAHPKIADYPFTTIEPQLGVVQIDVDASFVLVDVPGLIEGASRGAGLGDTFLRHIERTRVLVHLLDGALDPAEALAQLAMIEAELRAWNSELLAKRRVVAVSKQDLAGAEQTLRAVQQSTSDPVFGISAATGHGVRPLMAEIYRAILDAKVEQAPALQSEVVLRPKPATNRIVRIVKEKRAFRIVGDRLERLAAVTDFDSDDAREFFERALVRSGARRKLERAGIRPGDTVSQTEDGRIDDRSQSWTGNLHGTIQAVSSPSGSPVIVRINASHTIVVDVGSNTRITSSTPNTMLADADQVTLSGMLDQALGEMTHTAAIIRLGP